MFNGGKLYSFTHRKLSQLPLLPRPLSACVPVVGCRDVDG